MAVFSGPVFKPKPTPSSSAHRKAWDLSFRNKIGGESGRRGRERGPRGRAREEAPTVAAAPPRFTDSKAGRHFRNLCLTF